MKTQKSVLYLTIFLLLSSIIGWFYLILPLSTLNDILSNASTWVDTNLVSRYPDDLIISVKSGQVSVNRETPYCLVLDDKSQSGIVFTGDRDPRVLSLTDETYSSLCKPIALVGTNYYVYPDKENTYKVETIPATVNYNLDKNQIVNFVNQYLPLILRSGRNLYYFVPFMATPLLLIIFLSQNLWYSWVAKTIIKIFKLHPNDKKLEIYGTSLFIYTIILFVDWVIIGLLLNYILKQNIHLSFPFFNSLVIGIGTSLMLKSDTPSQLDNDHSPPPPAI
ncbi:MAG: hypothetical protein WC841_03195 [Candidatus Shapirobacteria bacterium]|jgi:hypothetical protein